MQGLILYVFDVGISLQIRHSTLNGAVSIHTRQQELEIEIYESEFLPRLPTASAGNLYLEGFTINTQANMSLTTKTSIFHGCAVIHFQ